MDNDTIKEGILYLLDHESVDSPDGMGFTFFEIMSFLTLNNLLDEGEIEFLKNLLSDMEQDRLIEERYFDDGRVDYSIENRGKEILETTNVAHFELPDFVEV